MSAVFNRGNQVHHLLIKFVIFSKRRALSLFETQVKMVSWLCLFCMCIWKIIWIFFNFHYNFHSLQVWYNICISSFEFRHAGVVKHYHIKQDENKFYKISPRHCFPTIPELIEYHKLNSGGVFHCWRATMAYFLLSFCIFQVYSLSSFNWETLILKFLQLLLLFIFMHRSCDKAASTSNIRHQPSNCWFRTW